MEPQLGGLWGRNSPRRGRAELPGRTQRVRKGPGSPAAPSTPGLLRHPQKRTCGVLESQQ